MQNTFIAYDQSTTDSGGFYATLDQTASLISLYDLVDWSAVSKRHVSTNFVYCLCSNRNYVSYRRGSAILPTSAELQVRQFRFSSVPSAHNVFTTGVAPTSALTTAATNNIPYHEYIVDVSSHNFPPDVMFFTSIYSCK